MSQSYPLLTSYLVLNGDRRVPPFGPKGAEAGPPFPTQITHTYTRLHTKTKV
jgi:hypothetical protein